MAARLVLGPLWMGIVLGAIALGTAGAQDTPSSPMDQNSVATDSSSSQDAPPTDAAVATTNDNPDTAIKKVGTPFPLGMDPGGYRIGPLHLINVTTSGFYNVAKPQEGGGTHTFLGSDVGADLVYTHLINNGIVAVQANPTVYISGNSPYLNLLGGVSLNKQLTQRWSMTANAQWTYYQNQYLLQTPQYLLAYTSGGLVLQTLYAQQNGSTIYETNNFSMNYQVSGRTQLSLAPTVNVTFNDVDGKSNLLSQFGGGANLSHSFTPNRSASLYGNITHSTMTQSQASGLPDWMTYNLGAGLNQKFGQSWFLDASIGASLQSGPNQAWLPTGTASLMKAFHKGSVTVAYSRGTAAATLLSSGYFDQADFAATRQFGSKVSTSLNLGVFRSVDTGTSNNGKRATASLYYGWRRNLAWSFSYSYTDQSSTQASLYSGQTSYFSGGLTWTLGHPTTR